MLRKMVIPGERITEESEDTDETASMGDKPGRLEPDFTASPVHTRSYGKEKKEKNREYPHNKGYKGEGVVHLPGDINGLARKFQSLFFW